MNYNWIKKSVIAIVVLGSVVVGYDAYFRAEGHQLRFADLGWRLHFDDFNWIEPTMPMNLSPAGRLIGALSMGLAVGIALWQSFIVHKSVKLAHVLIAVIIWVVGCEFYCLNVMSSTLRRRAQKPPPPTEISAKYPGISFDRFMVSKNMGPWLYVVQGWTLAVIAGAFGIARVRERINAEGSQPSRVVSRRA